MIDGHLLKITTVVNKIVPDFLDTLYKYRTYIILSLFL